MLNIKCFHCSRSFALDEALVAAWLEEHQQEHPKHYPAQCHYCRRTIKVPVRQIRRRMPPPDRSTPTEGAQAVEEV